MQYHDLMLPGGLSRDGQIERHVRLHLLTGRLEHQLAKAANEPDRVTFVSAVLAAAIKTIGGSPLDVDLAEQLCIADRQFLMMRLASHLAGEKVWLKATCGACDSLFDVDINRNELPVKKAGKGYPFAQLLVDDLHINVRVPTGADQRVAANDNSSDEDALLKMLDRCIVFVNGKPPPKEFAQTLSQSHIDAIDQALEEVAPAVCNQLQLSCPECKQQQIAEIDHYQTEGFNLSFLFDEIHTLAMHYHWSEADILDLPRETRQRYVSMIHQSQGHG